jgi:hypothetical protein
MDYSTDGLNEYSSPDIKACKDIPSSLSSAHTDTLQGTQSHIFINTFTNIYEC